MQVVSITYDAHQHLQNHDTESCVGAGLPSVMCVLTGAAKVTITDHPSSPAFYSIFQNIKSNISSSRSRTVIEIRSYLWGNTSGLIEKNHWLVAAKGAYDKVILADCLWMPSQHENLVISILHFLGVNKGSCAIVVAGFHTGRQVVADFLDLATTFNCSDSASYLLQLVEAFEIDVDGHTRDWQPDRISEDKHTLKKWCLVAILTTSAH